MYRVASVSFVVVYGVATVSFVVVYHVASVSFVVVYGVASVSFVVVYTTTNCFVCCCVHNNKRFSLQHRVTNVLLLFRLLL